MKSEDVAVVAQLLAAIKDATVRLERAFKNKDGAELNAAKKEILSFQKQIQELL